MIKMMISDDDDDDNTKTNNKSLIFADSTFGDLYRTEKVSCLVPVQQKRNWIIYLLDALHWP